MSTTRTIRIKEFEPLLIKQLGNDVTQKLFILLDSYLPCNTCKKVLPLSDFSICKANRNRLGRYADCRYCARSKYEDMKQYS